VLELVLGGCRCGRAGTPRPCGTLPSITLCASSRRRMCRQRSCKSCSTPWRCVSCRTGVALLSRHSGVQSVHLTILLHGPWAMGHGAITMAHEEEWSRARSALQKAMGHGPWSMGHGRWAMVDGPWSMGHGRWAMVDGPWAMGHGRWAMGHGPWSMGHGPWSSFHGACPACHQHGLSLHGQARSD